MAIKLNGGENPTGVKFVKDGITTNLTEVWHKTSLTADAVKVWPDKESMYYWIEGRKISGICHLSKYKKNQYYIECPDALNSTEYIQPSKLVEYYKKYVPWYTNFPSRFIIEDELTPTGMSYWFTVGDQDGYTIEGLENINTANLKSLVKTFDNCANEVLDLSTWEVNKLVRRISGVAQPIYYTFSNCDNLKTIYVGSDWTYEDGGALDASGTTDTFANCDNLVGGAGTIFSDNHHNGDYARIDNPPTAPGYFTLKQ